MKIISIIFLLLICFGTISAQNSHKQILDDPKVKYYDLEGRLVSLDFFKEVNMGFRMQFIMERTEADTVIRKIVWVDTIENDKKKQTSKPN